jgi:hypothetical protein
MQPGEELASPKTPSASLPTLSDILNIEEQRVCVDLSDRLRVAWDDDKGGQYELRSS